MQLHEKHRPRSWSEVVGQPRALARIEAIRPHGFGGRSYWVSGASGVGKTTMARIIAAEVADPFWTMEFDSADSFRQAEVESMAQLMYMYGGGKGGRAFIINEAHGLRAPIIRQLLGILERLPSHVVVIFTTTRQGEAKLFDDAIDAEPLLSRCVCLSLTSQGLAKAMAPVLQAAAQGAGLNGQPVEAYVRLMGSNHNNVRACYQAIEAGRMAGAGS